MDKNWRCSHGWLRGEQCEICNAPKREWQGLTDEEIAIASAEFDLKSKIAYRAGMYKAQIILRKKNDPTY